MCEGPSSDAFITRAALGKHGVVVEWQDGAQMEFHLCWLRDTCPCDTCVSVSGQKLPRVVVPGDESLKVTGLEVSKNGVKLNVKWKDHHDEEKAGEFGEYDSKWLRKFVYSTEVMEKESERKKESNIPEAGLVIPEVEFSTLFSGEKGVWEWMKQLNQTGFCVVRNTPCEDLTVKKVANLVGPCSHTIYGETFDVKVTPRPINIAYSDTELEPHMDLAYYESPPGIQMLHCLQFDEGVVGGESTLIDGHAVAEEFKKRFPEDFEVLAKVPATFQKDHMERSFPLKMFYQRPHIHLNYLGEVTAVFWSPPFQGPLRVRPEFVEPYYKAYHAFRNFLHSKEMWDRFGVVFKLRPGDLLVFNNRRMLHGRKSFKAANGGRHLQGCYLDVDTYLNKFRVMAHTMDPRADEACLAAPYETRFGISSYR